MRNASPDNEILTDPVLIDILLEKAKNKRSILTVRMLGNEDEFLSMILDIDQSGRYLYMDSLRPDQGDLDIQKTGQFKAHTKLQGVTIEFESKLIKTLKSDKQSKYQISYPSSLLYHERRVSHRVNIGRGLNVKAKINCSLKQVITARVADLSPEGIGLVMSSKLAKKILTSPQPIEVEIHFSEDEILFTNLDFCHGHQYNEEENLVHLGAKFDDLSLRNKNHILKQIRIFERENIRKTPPETKIQPTLS